LYVPFSFGDNSGGATDVGAFARFNGNVLEFAEAHSGVNSFALTTTQVFRDPSAWYHFVFSVDTTQATASNRLKIFVNGTQITAFSTATYPSQNFNTSANQSGNAQRIGVIDVDGTVTGQYYDGYMTEVQFIDGQALTPSSFGETDAVTGVWKPKKYAGTYGTNGFYLNFSDNSAATATTIGKDYSGNGNNFTPTNISVTAGATYDSMLDVPTMWADGGNGRGNYCTLNPLKLGPSFTLSNANLSLSSSLSTNHQSFGTIGVTSGKWYWEVLVESALETYIGVATDSASSSSWTGAEAVSWSYRNLGSKYNAGTPVAYAATYTTNDVIGVALDMDAGTLTFYKNGTSLGQAYSGITGVILPALSPFASGAALSANFGQRPFAYTPPTGFKALNTQNLPDATIKKGNQYFDATTYTGTGAAQSIVNSGAMQPDLVWLKARSQAYFHNLNDSVRGTNKRLFSNTTDAEDTTANCLTAFNSNGFTVGSNQGINENTTTMVAWQWKESVSAGFDIVTYTGNGVSNRTVSHSLGVAPKMIIVKDRDSNSNSNDWFVWHTSLAANNNLLLNTTNATVNVVSGSAGGGIGSSPTSSVFTLQNGTSSNVNTNESGDNYVAYLFAEVAGFSKFGSYTGNGSTDGPFVYLGFRPKFVMIKCSSASGTNWTVYDTSRNPSNVSDLVIYANSSSAEASGITYPHAIDILSNGFKTRNYDATYGVNINTSGATYIYAAFAENPFKNSLAR